jgi:hypothetical protein
MNYLQKLAVRSHLQKLLTKGNKILNGKIDINYLKDLVAITATAKDEIKISEHSTQDFSEFANILTSQLKRHLKYDKIDVIIMFCDFAGNEDFTEIYFQYNGKKEFYSTKKK